MRIEHQGETFELEVPREDAHIARILERTGTFYELDLLLYVRHVLRGRTDGLAIDVGANLGNHSVWFGRHCASEVLAIEPNPELQPILRRNLGRAEVRARVLDIGLGADDGTADLVMPEDERDVGMVRLGDGGRDGDIVVRPLDAVLAEHREITGRDTPVRLIKIDVEGMEPDVLAGATRTLETDRPELFIEAATPDARETLVRHLRPLGYVDVAAFAVTPVIHFAPADSAAAAAFRRVEAALYVARRAPRSIARRTLRSLTGFIRGTNAGTEDAR